MTQIKGCGLAKGLVGAPKCMSQINPRVRG